MASRRFPAEWEQQQGLLLGFPHNGKDWPGKIGAIQWAFVEFIKKVAEYEQVFLVVKDKAHQYSVHELLDRATVQIKQVSYIHQKTNRSWMRDAGPIIVKKGSQREAINFNFNAWAKYTNFQLDKHIPASVANHLGIPLTQALYKGKPVVMEGGALEVNGKGTLITTEECMLDPRIQVRNPGFTRANYEQVFKDYLGIEKTIWLGKGITGDDTHGHVDDLCRFVNEDTVVTVVEPNKKSKNHAPLLDNVKRLKKERLANGKPLNVVELPMPRPIIFEGLELPASYANFIIINKCVLVPTFNDVNDRLALDIIASCFPKREVIGINCIDLIWGFGTLHCLSQQVPK